MYWKCAVVKLRCRVTCGVSEPSYQHRSWLLFPPPSSCLRRVSRIFSGFCPTKQSNMPESNSKSKIDSAREWIIEHKLRSVGCLWLSGIVGSIAYNWSQPGMKTSVRIIHARLHAQALTLAALAGAAVVEYYDHKSGAKSERYAKFLDSKPHKD